MSEMQVYQVWGFIALVLVFVFHLITKQMEDK